MSLCYSDEYCALVAAIRADPDNDLPRLVVADWLEEHGELKRAEYIRVRVRIANPQPGDDVRKLTKRGQDLHIDQSVIGVSMWHGTGLGYALMTNWERGFVVSIAIKLSNWLAHGDRIYRCHPIRLVMLSIPELDGRPNEPISDADEEVAQILLSNRKRYPGVSFQHWSFLSAGVARSDESR